MDKQIKGRGKGMRQAGIWLVIGTLLMGKMGLAPSIGRTAQRLTMATPAKSVSFLPLYVAVNRGFFQDEGIDLKLLVAKASIGLTALVNGDVDYSGAFGSSIRVALQGMPVRVVAAVQDKPTFFAVTRPDVKSIQALKGKRIGITSFGGTDDLATRRVLEHFGLNPEKDVTLFVTGTTALSLASLRAGAIDAALLSPPFNVLAKKEGYNELLYFGDIIQFPQGGFSATLTRIKEKRPQVKGMVRATVRGLRYTWEQPEELARIIAKEWNFDLQTARAVYDKAVMTYSRDGSVSEEGMRTSINFERQSLKLTREVPISQVADFSILNEVLRELKATGTR